MQIYSFKTDIYIFKTDEHINILLDFALYLNKTIGKCQYKNNLIFQSLLQI